MKEANIEFSLSQGNTLMAQEIIRDMWADLGEFTATNLFKVEIDCDDVEAEFEALIDDLEAAGIEFEVNVERLFI